MAYRGIVAPGSEIGVRLMAADSNREPAGLSAGMGEKELAPGSPSLSVAPGTSRAIALNAGASGKLRVHVHFTRPDAKGELEVRVNGAVHDFSMVLGETWWDYDIATPEHAGSTGPGAPTVFRGGTDSRHAPR